MYTLLMLGGLVLLVALLVFLIVWAIVTAKDLASSNEEDLLNRMERYLNDVGPMVLGAFMVVGGIFFLIKELLQ